MCSWNHKFLLLARWSSQIMLDNMIISTDIHVSFFSLCYTDNITFNGKIIKFEKCETFFNASLDFTGCKVNFTLLLHAACRQHLFSSYINITFDGKSIKFEKCKTFGINNCWHALANLCASVLKQCFCISINMHRTVDAIGFRVLQHSKISHKVYLIRP